MVWAPKQVNWHLEGPGMPLKSWWNHWLLSKFWKVIFKKDLYMLKHIFCWKNSEYRFILLFWSVLQNTWSQRHNMPQLSWLSHNLVLGSFYSQQLMNSMVKMPRQFENILDVGLQGLCPWTLLGNVYSMFPGPLLYSLDHSLCLSKVTRKSHSVHTATQIQSSFYLFLIKNFFYEPTFFIYILQVKSSNKQKIKHNDILKISEIF